MGDSETPFAPHTYGLDADDKEWKDDFPQIFREADQIDRDLERGRSTDIQAEEYLQRFRSQDGTALGSLKARYFQFRKRKVYYLLWNDVEAAIPDVDHLVVQPSSCLFLVDKTCKLYTPLRLTVTSSEAYTVVRKSADSPVLMDPSQDLIYSTGRVHPSEFSPTDDALDVLLSSLAIDNNILSLLAMIRQARLTYDNLFEITNDSNLDRYTTVMICTNMEHRHNRLQEYIAGLLAAVGNVETIQIEMVQVQGHLARRHRIATATEVFSRYRVDNRVLNDLDYPFPKQFLLLPFDVNSWDPTNPRTHIFRLHFLCDWVYPDVEAATETGHLLEHPGYAIHQWDEFLEQFGFVSLAILQSLKFTIEGIISEMEEEEQEQESEQESEQEEEEEEEEDWGVEKEKDRRDGRLRNLELLAEGSQFSATELGDLLDLAIESLQQTVIPQMKVETMPNIMPNICAYFANNGTANILNGLHPCPWYNGTHWECSHHFLNRYTQTTSETLSARTKILNGSYNMQQGTAEIKVRSMVEALEFFNIVNGSRSIISLAISILWDATKIEQQEILSGVADTSVNYLRLDCGGIRDHLIYTTEQGGICVRNIVTSSRLHSITFANAVDNINGSNSIEHITFILNMRIDSTGLPTMSSAEWGRFRQYIATFHKVVGYDRGDSKNDSDNEESSDEDSEYCNLDKDAIATLQELAAAHRYINSLTYLTRTHLAARFDMHDGVFHGLIEARFPVDFDEQFLYAGSLRRFVLEIDAYDPNYISTLDKIIQSNPNLLEVMVQTKEKELLSQIVFCYRCVQPNRTLPIQFTFFDECAGNQERTVAKLVLTSKSKDADQISGDYHDVSLGTVNITVLEWALDSFSEAITDDEAAILDLITAQVPSTLTNFVLDIGRLTKVGIESIQRLLSRSEICYLKIKCNSFNKDLRKHLLLALAHIQRFSLISLVLLGEEVDTWLQLLDEATTWMAATDIKDGSSTSQFMQLLQFQVINTAPYYQSLVEGSVQTVLYIAQSCSLIEFNLINVKLQASEQWHMVMKELDLAHLSSLNLGAFHGAVQARNSAQSKEQLRHRFVLEIDSTDPDYLLTLDKVLHCNPDLLEIRAQTKNKLVLLQIVMCCQHVPGRVFPLQVTLYDKCVKEQERVVASLVLSPKAQDGDHGLNGDLHCHGYLLSSVDIEVLEWTVDYISETLTDNKAAVLNAITAQFPETLISFTLDISHLTKAGIDNTLQVLSRSRIWFLRINCSEFAEDQKINISRILDHLQGSSVRSLSLCGEAVHSWLQLLQEVNPDLLEISVLTKEKRLLSEIVFCCRYVPDRTHPLQVTFYDQYVGCRERVMAVLILTPTSQDVESDSEDALDHGDVPHPAVGIKTLEWAMDHVSTALTDDEAAVLDTITAQSPPTLTSFNLDIKYLTKVGIARIGRVLSRSQTQFLLIKCHTFDQSLAPTLATALACLQRSLPTSLTFHGEAIDAWLQLLVLAVGTPACMKLGLDYFEIVASGTAQQTLSPTSIWVVMVIVQSCSLIELSLENVRLATRAQWDQVVTTLDFSQLRCLSLARSNIQNVADLLTEFSPANTATMESAELSTMEVSGASAPTPVNLRSNKASMLRDLVLTGTTWDVAATRELRKKFKQDVTKKLPLLKVAFSK
ncbi:hypothetical protein MVEG_02979 [Podila verticillata NRRL 6337]|nr:hypothetical protein MVEG_02979 [Podila verticillata NRRL 6337]